MDPSASEPKYANGPGPIVIDSGRNPSGSAIVVIPARKPQRALGLLEHHGVPGSRCGELQQPAALDLDFGGVALEQPLVGRDEQGVLLQLPSAADEPVDGEAAPRRRTVEAGGDDPRAVGV